MLGEMSHQSNEYPLILETQTGISCKLSPLLSSNQTLSSVLLYLHFSTFKRHPLCVAVSSTRPRSHLEQCVTLSHTYNHVWNRAGTYFV